jgi:hypothetical protein
MVPSEQILPSTIPAHAVDSKLNAPVQRTPIYISVHPKVFKFVQHYFPY